MSPHALRPSSPTALGAFNVTARFVNHSQPTPQRGAAESTQRFVGSRIHHHSQLIPQYVVDDSPWLPTASLTRHPPRPTPQYQAPEPLQPPPKPRTKRPRSDMLDQSLSLKYMRPHEKAYLKTPEITPDIFRRFDYFRQNSGGGEHRIHPNIPFPSSHQHEQHVGEQVSDIQCPLPTTSSSSTTTAARGQKRKYADVQLDDGQGGTMLYTAGHIPTTARGSKRARVDNQGPTILTPDIPSSSTRGTKRARIDDPVDDVPPPTILPEIPLSSTRGKERARVDAEVYGVQDSTILPTRISSSSGREKKRARLDLDYSIQVPIVSTADTLSSVARGKKRAHVDDQVYSVQDPITNTSVIPSTSGRRTKRPRIAEQVDITQAQNIPSTDTPGSSSRGRERQHVDPHVERAPCSTTFDAEIPALPATHQQEPKQFDNIQILDTLDVPRTDTPSPFNIDSLFMDMDPDLMDALSHILDTPSFPNYTLSSSITVTRGDERQCAGEHMDNIQGPSAPYTDTPTPSTHTTNKGKRRQYEQVNNVHGPSTLIIDTPTARGPKRQCVDEQEDNARFATTLDNDPLVHFAAPTSRPQKQTGGQSFHDEIPVAGPSTLPPPQQRRRQTTRSQGDEVQTPAASTKPRRTRPPRPKKQQPPQGPVLVRVVPQSGHGAYTLPRSSAVPSQWEQVNSEGCDQGTLAGAPPPPTVDYVEIGFTELKARASAFQNHIQKLQCIKHVLKSRLKGADPKGELAKIERDLELAHHHFEQLKKNGYELQQSCKRLNLSEERMREVRLIFPRVVPVRVASNVEGSSKTS
ncbi:hypothetical protein SCP_1601720 [Sparassis crispa]|uniref:Uncharacterized protein n=1 Tax=Sparassis crispa TaxID=139825 RepID=A0A401H582_9APHY|nr:hypothetical protein SCP_1601720 [Sparassis crispa]GBE89510.1 hypothetical protein SCP_1601720 [Sparassis crispa]